MKLGEREGVCGGGGGGWVTVHCWAGKCAFINYQKVRVFKCSCSIRNIDVVDTDVVIFPKG